MKVKYEGEYSWTLTETGQCLVIKLIHLQFYISYSLYYLHSGMRKIEGEIAIEGTKLSNY
jgi:hypothetical protein